MAEEKEKKGLKNKVCDTLKDIKKIKQDVFNFISKIKTFCNFYPAFEFPTSIPSALNPKQAVLEFLRDLLAVLQGVDIEKIKNALVNWLVIEVIPIEIDIKFLLKGALKRCYACKITPTIPGWLFQTTDNTTFDVDFIDPTTGKQNTSNKGLGINLPVNVLDLKTCFLRINPNSRGGKLLYGPDSDYDMNRFLWDVIQDDGATNGGLRWRDPVTQRTIAWFTYYEDSKFAFTAADSNSSGYQNTEVAPMVINMRIDDSYKDKTLITFLNDYINSQLPIFSGEKVITTAIDYIYGTITKEINLPSECVENGIIRDKIAEGLYDTDDDEDEITTDNSFFEFSEKEIINIKETAINKQGGQRYYTNCCERKSASIPFAQLEKINNELSKKVGEAEKATILNKAFADLADASARGVNSIDRQNGIKEFYELLLLSFSIALVRLTLSPKIMALVLTLYYLCNSSLKFTDTQAIMSELKCIIKSLIKELLRKFIYEFLLPLILKALKDFIKCYITLKIKERWELYYKQKVSLLIPPQFKEAVQKAQEALGKAGQVVDAAEGVVNSINDFNIGSKNIKIDLNKKTDRNGKFCG